MLSKSIDKVISLVKNLNKKSNNRYTIEQINQDFNNIDSFENLKKAMSIKSDNPEFTKYNISTISNKFPFMKWEKFFNNLFTRVGMDSPISGQTEVLVQVRVKINLNYCFRIT